LCLVTLYSSRNKMTTQNLGIVFGPTLLKILTEDLIRETSDQTKIIQFMLDHFHEIFKDSPVDRNEANFTPVEVTVDDEGLIEKLNGRSKESGVLPLDARISLSFAGNRINPIVSQLSIFFADILLTQNSEEKCAIASKLRELFVADFVKTKEALGEIPQNALVDMLFSLGILCNIQRT